MNEAGGCRHNSSMIKEYAPLVVSVVIPLLAVLFRAWNERQDPGAVRLIRRHVELAKEMPASSKLEMEELLAVESKAYAARMKRRAIRELSGAGLAAFIFVAVVFVGLLYATLMLGIGVDNVWGWIPFVVIAVVGIAFLSVGAMQIYTYPGYEKEPKKK